MVFYVFYASLLLLRIQLTFVSLMNIDENISSDILLIFVKKYVIRQLRNKCTDSHFFCRSFFPNRVVNFTEIEHKCHLSVKTAKTSRVE